MSTPEPLWLERLDWLRGLARQLVRDDCAADDLTQEVVLKALRAGRADAPREWWTRVLRTTAWDRARGARNRRARERDVGDRGVAPDAHSVVGEAEAQRRVSDAVLALDEPYRTVLLLRYFKDLQPRTIARELDRPVGTVKVQLERARALLRERLRGELGGGGASLALALLPLAGPIAPSAIVAGTAVPLTAAVAMKVAWIVPLSLLVALGAWSVLTTGPGAAPIDVDGAAAAGRSELDRAGAAAATVDGPDELVDADVPSGRRNVSGPSAADRTNDAHAPAAPAIARGIAMDVEGRPLQGVVLNSTVDGDVVTGTTDASGRFELANPSRWEPGDAALSIVARRVRNDVHELRLARAIRFAGTVVDGEGAGLSGAWTHDTESIELARGGGPSWSTDGGSSARVGDDGRFDLGRVRSWPGRTILFTHDRFGVVEFPVPETDTLDARVVFDGAGGDAEITVIVVDGDGRAASDAALLVWGSVRAVAADGRSVVTIDDRTGGTEAVAARTGFLPVRWTLPTVDDLRSGAAQDTIEIAVDRPGSAISGRVVDARGRPVPGAKMAIWNADTLGSYGTVETLRVRGGSADFERSVTDADGRFELRGIADRPATVRAIVDEPLRVAEARDVAPGTTDLVLVVGRAADAVVREGHVVDLDGVPIEGVRILVEARLVAPDGNPNFEVRRAVDGWSDRTDAEGRFSIGGFVPGGVRVRADHRNAVATIDADADDLTLVFDVPCDIDVRLVRPGAGRELVVLDADGARLPFSRITAGMIFSGYESLELDGTEDSTRLRVSQSAAHVVLLEDDREVARAAVDPDRFATTSVGL